MWSARIQCFPHSPNWGEDQHLLKKSSAYLEGLQRKRTVMEKSKISVGQYRCFLRQPWFCAINWWCFQTFSHNFAWTVKSFTLGFIWQTGSINKTWRRQIWCWARRILNLVVESFHALHSQLNYPLPILLDTWCVTTSICADLSSHCEDRPPIQAR